MKTEPAYRDLSLTSEVFPGGSLLAAMFDRRLMRLSDRGGASGLIGDRWADLCAMALEQGAIRVVQTADGSRQLRIEHVVRLDHIPSVALAASRQKLQNPDFILVCRGDGGEVTLSADAKFSVETAAASQVSAESLRALLRIGPVVGQHLGPVVSDAVLADGTFLCPDYSLTHFMLAGQRGARRVSVSASQVTLLPASAPEFLRGLEAASLVPLFADVDALPLDFRKSLLLSLYYFRLVRAGVGCWYDQVGPLLDQRDRPALDLAPIEDQARRLAGVSGTAWEMIERWDALAEAVRQQRAAVGQVTALPLVNRELREQVETMAAAEKVVPPSLTKVRRRIGAWFRDQLREEFGPIQPPVDDFPALLMRLAQRSRELRPEIAKATEEIILEMLQESPSLSEAEV